MTSDRIFLYSCVSIQSEPPCKISWSNSQKQKSFGQKTAAKDDFLHFSHGKQHPKIFFFIKSDVSSHFIQPRRILLHKSKKQKRYGQKSLKSGRVPGPLSILNYNINFQHLTPQKRKLMAKKPASRITFCNYLMEDKKMLFI